MACDENYRLSVGPDDEGCKLLDSFAIFIQIILVATAVLLLVFKRWQERPQRPVPIWALDVSKQFVGALAVHFLNLMVSYMAGRPHRGPKTNLCVWYFLNIAIDTTFGVGILWVWLKLLQKGLAKLGVEDIHSGKYGPPPLRRQLVPWAKQTAVFILAESLMKLCVFSMFRAFPFLFAFGEWILEWTKGNYRYQVIFVMLIFPLIMGGVQFWVVDTIVKVTPQKPLPVPTNTSPSDLERSPLSESNEQTPLLPKNVP